MNKLTLFIALILLTSQAVFALSQCKCTPSYDPFPGSNPQTSDIISISKDNEVIGSIDAGKLINFGSTTILQTISDVQKTSSVTLTNSCPSGYVPLTKEDLDVISLRPDFKDLIGTTYLNLSANVMIFSSTKVYPTINNPGDLRAYTYYVLKLDQSKNPIITASDTYFVEDSVRKTICKRTQTSFTISLEGYEGYDLEEGKTYQMKIVNKNVLKYYIEDNNGKKYTTQTFNYLHQGNSQWGCATINFRLQVFGGAIVGDCIGIWTQPQFAYNSASNIQVSQITKVTIPNVKSNVNNNMFFNPGSAPVAPIIKDSSSVYVYYSEQTTMVLKVQKLSKVGIQIGNPIDTKEVGMPLDIVSTPFGFVVMAFQSTQKTWISAFNKDGSLRWKRILQNNGPNPVSTTDSIQFTINDKCELPSGMNAMFNPHNGRLVYARGRIVAIWAHYNHFGMYSDGVTRNDHTGDTMISLDSDTGYNQKIYWAWGTSHSLYQNLHYDGRYVYVASLGDAYPMGIHFRVCDVDRNLECKISSTVIPGQIPGNGGGSTAGRQGSFIDIVGKKGEKYFVYQRKASQGGYNGSVSVNDKNELALIRIDKNLQLISTQVILEGELAARVNSIKAVRYGQNILIAYSVIPADAVGNYNPSYVRQSVDEAYLTLLNGTNGSVISAATKFASYQINASDDWRILEDGRIVYTFVDSENNLNFFYTPALKLVTYPNPIKLTDKVYGQGSFLNEKFIARKNNYNDVCKKDGDPNFQFINYLDSNGEESILVKKFLETTNAIRLYSVLFALLLNLFL